MDNKKIAAIVVVIIIIVAAVAVYFTMGGGDDEKTNNAHALDLDGIEANEDNVLNGTYEIQRNLVLVTKGEPTGNVALFLDWITCSQGQAILAEEFVPLDVEDQNAIPAAPDQNGQTEIQLGGSTSLTETMTKLVEEYMTLYPYMNLKVGTGGSGAGETGAAEGSLDIGMLSRDMGSEYEGTLVDHNIGRDGVAVVANINGVDNLTMEQVAAIFSGEITNWSEVGGPDETIRVVIRESSSGTRECFENAMKTVDSDWTVTSNATSYNSTGGVIGQIQDLYGSIGYISIGQVKNLAPVSGPHALELDGIEATEDNVLNGTYEIQRNLVLVTKGEPTGNVALFLDWITCSQGQAILAEEFVPLDVEDQNAIPAAPDENGQTEIQLGGSTSLTETMTKLVEEYMALYPYMNLKVGTGGSGAGETGAAEGSLDIGMLSRDMGSEYEGILVDHNIGKDGVAVVANIEGVTELTMEEVAAIFSGEITNWSEVGGPDETIRVVIRESSSGTRECFENAMKEVDPEWTVTSQATSYNSTGGVIGQVQDLYGSIGYISIGQVPNLTA